MLRVEVRVISHSNTKEGYSPGALPWTTRIFLGVPSTLMPKTGEIANVKLDLEYLSCTHQTRGFLWHPLKSPKMGN